MEMDCQNDIRIWRERMDAGKNSPRPGHPCHEGLFSRSGEQCMGVSRFWLGFQPARQSARGQSVAIPLRQLEISKRGPVGRNGATKRRPRWAGHVLGQYEIEPVQMS